MLWRGFVLFHPLYDPELHMSNYDFFLNLCQAQCQSLLREKTFTPSAVYGLPFKITIENKLRSFQFKLMHNILPTNQRLRKMNGTSSSKCAQCDAPCETISHIFYECLAVKIFGKKS